MGNKWGKFIDQSGSRSKYKIKIKIFELYPTSVKCSNPHCQILIQFIVINLREWSPVLYTNITYYFIIT